MAFKEAEDSGTLGLLILIVAVVAIVYMLYTSSNAVTGDALEVIYHACDKNDGVEKIEVDWIEADVVCKDTARFKVLTMVGDGKKHGP